jgi:hypothetical protein
VRGVEYVWNLKRSKSLILDETNDYGHFIWGCLCNLGISGVAEAFQLIPSGLSPGNQYRLVFVTDGTIQATSTDINTYNTFVDNEAHNSTILNDAFTNVGIDPASITWKVIGSTASVNAIGNTSTNTVHTSVPIYGLDRRTDRLR